MAVLTAALVLATIVFFRATWLSVLVALTGVGLVGWSTRRTVKQRMVERLRAYTRK